MTTAIAAEKACRTCGTTKPLDEFYADRSAKDGRGSKCRACWRGGAAPASRKPAAPRAVREEPLADFAPGVSCINCGLHRDHFPNEERQLPKTSKRFPLCAECLTWARRIEGPRFGILEA